MSWLKDMWDKFASAEVRTLGDAHSGNRSTEPQSSSLDRVPYDPPVNPGITSNTDSGGPSGDGHGGDHGGGWW